MTSLSAIEQLGYTDKIFRPGTNKGTILVNKGNAAGTYEHVPVGNNDDVLIADSTQTSGVTWVDPYVRYATGFPYFTSSLTGNSNPYISTSGVTFPSQAAIIFFSGAGIRDATLLKAVVSRSTDTSPTGGEIKVNVPLNGASYGSNIFTLTALANIPQIVTITLSGLPVNDSTLEIQYRKNGAGGGSIQFHSYAFY